MGAAVEFRVLGPVELSTESGRVTLGSAKQRCALAVLLVGAGQPYPVEVLIDRVWGEDPPPQVRGALYSYVSRLRRVLREAGVAAAITQRAGGYLLDVPAGAVDLHRFEELVQESRADGDVRTRAATLGAALELWRGPALQDLSGRWADEVRHRLGRRRVWARAEWAQAMIELGRYAVAGEELERELEDSPYAEPLAAQLMTCLARQGREAEALACYADFRARLADELGVEPGPALQEVHVRILRGERVVGVGESARAPGPGEEPVPAGEPDGAAALGGPAASTEGPARPGTAAPELRSGAPYLGLRTFEPEDAARYFGRQELVDEVLERLRHRRFLAVFGPSGSGKSSLLRAGVLATVHGSGRWTARLMTPAEHPLASLAAALAPPGETAAVRRALAAAPSSLGAQLERRSPGESTLLVVDQFEETFTQCRDERERAQFVEALLSLADGTAVAARVVIGVRADFLATCAEFPALVALLRDDQLLIGPMSEEDLRAVITGPAARAGLDVEPGLVDAVLGDVLGAPAALPMVSHALLETWRRRDGSRLALAKYREAGGVRGAVAQTADRVYLEFGDRRRRIARELFLRLTAPGEGAEDTRRRAGRAELLDRSDGAEVAVVLARLAEARLVTLDEDTVTVVHESLIRGWPRLRGWLDEDRDRLRAHRRLTEHAADWRLGGRDEGLLYRGTRLDRWKDLGTGSLNDLEREFLFASRRRQEKERYASRRRARLVRGTLSAVVVVLLVLTTFAFVQTGQAERRRTQALAGRLVADARSVLALDPELTLLLARRAYELDPGVQAEALLAQAISSSRVRGVLTGHRGPVTSLAYAPDGTLVSGGADGTVRRWPAGGGAPEVLDAHGEVRQVAVAPDGRTAAVTATGAVLVWPRGRGALPLVRQGNRDALALRFAPDGRSLLVAASDGTLSTWPDDGGAPVVRTGPRGEVATAAVSPDGRRVAAADAQGGVRLWEPATGAVTSLPGTGIPVSALAFSGDGSRLIGGHADGRDQVWAVTGNPAAKTFYPNRDRVRTVAFSGDGRFFLSGGLDRTTHVWRWTGGAGDFTALRGQPAPVHAAAFAPGDRVVATGSDDGTIRWWDAVSRPGLRELRARANRTWDSVDGTAPSPDGRFVAAAGADGTVEVDRADGRGTPVLLTGHHGEATAVAFAADGRSVAGAGADGRVLIWPSTGGAPREIRTGHTGAVHGVAFTPDGAVVTGGGDGTVRITRPGGEPEVLAVDSPVRAVAVSASGEIAAAADDGPVRLWRPGAPGRPLLLPAADGMRTVAFTADGGYLAGAGNSGTVQVWRTADGTPATELVGHYGLVLGVAFSPDGQFLASVGNDKKLRLWRWQAWRDPVVFDDYNATVTSVSFGADGSIYTGRGAGDAAVDGWDCEFCRPGAQLARLAATRVTRDFTPAERQRYLADDG